jgi:short-subunit dehydrogenase
MKDLNGKVAAITGAASGIGRALALELAGRGCHLALSDIDGDGLAQTVHQAQCLGVEVSQAVVDVSDRTAVFAWADTCRATHGKVNLIFNNAGKFGVRGFTEALRLELELEGAPVSATCVHPDGVATNIALAGRVDPALERVSGVDAQTRRQRAHRMIQVTTPQAAALQIITGVERNARRVLVGRDARMLDFFARLLGAGYQRMVLNKVRRMVAAAAARKPA